MRCQLLDPFIKPRDILQHRLDLGLDDTGGLMHTRITQDRPHRMQDQHQIVRPGHVDAAATAFLDKLGELQIDFGINRFRRQEHDRAVRRLARDDITLGDVVDMLLYIRFHHPAGRSTFGLAIGSGQRPVGFQRKLGIDADRTRRRRHIKETIDTAAIAKRMLEIESTFRKRVTNQVFQLHFTETAARLLVRQDILQLANLTGQRRYMGVRLLDHGKLLGHAGERAVGAVILVTKRVFKTGAETALGVLHLRGNNFLELAGLSGKLGKLSLQLGQRLAVMPPGSLAQKHNNKAGDAGKRKKDNHHVKRHG